MITHVGKDCWIYIVIISYIICVGYSAKLYSYLKHLSTAAKPLPCHPTPYHHLTKLQDPMLKQLHIHN
jgi:hypothetical protein